MPERASYTQGTPNWVDLQTTDQQAAKAFYGKLFGWDYDDQPMPQGAVYSMAMRDGHHVAAIAPQPPETAAAGAPAMWNTYLAVDDVDDSVTKVEGAGGQVVMPPMDVVDAGRMAFVTDPGGAGVALWQAGNHIGATLVNEPGAVIWNELVTTDSSAPAFYEQVLGLATSTMDMGDDGVYTLFNAGEAQVGGSTPPQAPGMPNHWHVYFMVGNVDDTAATAAKLGGSVLAGPFDTPVGRMATISDPQGATFTVMKPPEQTS